MGASAAQMAFFMLGLEKSLSCLVRQAQVWMYYSWASFNPSTPYWPRAGSQDAPWDGVRGQHIPTSPSLSPLWLLILLQSCQRLVVVKIWKVMMVPVIPTLFKRLLISESSGTTRQNDSGLKRYPTTSLSICNILHSCIGLHWTEGQSPNNELWIKLI